MKKIATLFFCTALFASAFAQSNNRNWDDRNNNGNPNWKSNTNQVYHDRDRDDNDRNSRYGRQYNNQTNSIAQRDMQVQRISQQYDYRIQQVKNDRSLTRREKKNAINALEAQKIQQIDRLNSQYNNSVYNHGYNRNNDYKQNNRYDKNRDYDRDNNDYNRYNK